MFLCVFVRFTLMFKDFDSWNKLKKEIEVKEKQPFFKIKDVWWCSLGINTGSETCGKNISFERPVLILYVFNRKLVLVAPLTSRYKEIPYRFKVSYKNRISYVMLDHIKSISTKRLTRNVYRMEDSIFKKILLTVKSLL